MIISVYLGKRLQRAKTVHELAEEAADGCLPPVLWTGCMQAAQGCLESTAAPYVTLQDTGSYGICFHPERAVERLSPG